MRYGTARIDWGDVELGPPKGALAEKKPQHETEAFYPLFYILLLNLWYFVFLTAVLLKVQLL